MSFLIPAITTILGGAGSYFSQQAAADKKKKYINDYRTELDKSKYSPDEVASAVSSVRAIGNTQMASALNQIAGVTAGSLNETQAKGAMIAPYLSSQAQTIFGVKQKYEDYNRQIDQQKAKASLMMGEAETDMGDVLGSALGGLEAGMAIDKFLNPVDAYGNPLNKGDIDSKELADKLTPDMPKISEGIDTPSWMKNWFANSNFWSR